MLREILTEVLSVEPDVEIVSDGEARKRRTDLDVVIAGAERLEPGEVDALLDANPRMRVLAIAGDGRQGFLYELRPQKVPLGEVSPQRLLKAIRAPSWARA